MVRALLVVAALWKAFWPAGGLLGPPGCAARVSRAPAPMSQMSRNEMWFATTTGQRFLVNAASALAKPFTWSEKPKSHRHARFMALVARSTAG